MKNNTVSSNDYQLFLFKAFLWLCLAWGAFTLTLIGFFYASFIWICFGILGLWFYQKAIRIGISLRISGELLIVSAALTILVTTFSLFSNPTVFVGRDQGSFSEAAARLAQNHQLAFSTPTSQEFFKLHESGRALNFPGFYYNNNGQLVTQFSLVYISWLALFFAVFGPTGFIVANALLLFTFFLSLYLLLRMFCKPSAAIPMIILAGTSFVFMWFSKLTLSENIALPLLWIALLSLMLFIKNPRRLYYFSFLAAIFLLCFARIEGFALLFSSIIIIFFNKEALQFIQEESATRILFPALTFMIFFLLNLYVDFYFYKEIAKALLPSVTTPQAKYLGEIKNNILPTFYTGKIFYLYGLLGFFITGGISIAFQFWKSNFYKLVPFFLALPTFLYFFDSQITPDHPWMLRRFMFSLLPLAIFYTGLLFSEFFENNNDSPSLKKYRFSAIAIFLILLAMNMPAFFMYLTYSDNKNMLSQVATLSTKFQDNDLILIDREASGDGWAMLSSPLNYLYHKNAVYFFNNQDLARLDISKFSKVYLIAPDGQVPFYLTSTIGEDLKQIDSYSFHTTRLFSESNSRLSDVMLPQKKDVQISGKIFEIEK
jgi:hypothetical protein